MAPMEMGDVHGAVAQNNPCLGGMVTATTTNIHFHGLNIAPVCHQDEVVKTLIPNNGIPFQYSLVIPTNDPPGLYWYHPHPHGFSAPQVYGGAAGALIIGGTNVLTQGLPERILTVRRNVDAVTDDDGQFTLNFEPANYPRRPLPVINMTAGQSEFWRVLNASTNGFLALQVLSPGPQPLQVISVDGIPLASPVTMSTINVPPAGRVEFIVPALTLNTPSFFTTNGFNTGPIGDLMPGGHLASIVIGPGKFDAAHAPHVVPAPSEAQRFSGLASVTPTTTRSLYFSELNVGTNGPGQFFITVRGQKQRLFDPKNGAAVTTQVGAVEDWTISNQTGEPHAFHMHQIHFLVMAINGVSVTNPYLADTITVPNWSGTGPYPSVTVRMDFRDPNIAGTFVYHCHILDHEDGGMMATIVVKP
jgi:FtsP/CotA-like multicopper oxidase with cupredoxin domain